MSEDKITHKGKEITMINKIFSLSQNVRYIAIYRDGELETMSKEGITSASGSESDRYEELLVNPTLLTLTTRRGNIGCGGLEYLIIRYGNFFQFVLRVHKFPAIFHQRWNNY